MPEGTEEERRETSILSSQDELAKFLEGRQLVELIDKNWVSLKVFANIQHVTYQTALRYVKQEKIKAIRFGGQWRIYEDELKRFLMFGNADNSKADNSKADNSKAS